MRERFVDVSGTEIFVREWGPAGAPALLYWDGLGGSGLHANEIAPILASRYALRVIAPDAPGHGRSPALQLEAYRPSVLAGLATELLSTLALHRIAFVGFSWGARIACSFGARFPKQTTGLVLIDGGYLEWADIPGVDSTADLETCIADARRDAENDSFPSWDAYFASESTSLRRWTPALEEAHRAMMREDGGRVVPVLAPEVNGAIRHGGYQEPVARTYPSSLPRACRSSCCRCPSRPSIRHPRTLRSTVFGQRCRRRSSGRCPGLTTSSPTPGPSSRRSWASGSLRQPRPEILTGEHVFV